MKKTLAAVAVLGAFAGSAIAADVTLYGRIDEGLLYQRVDADQPHQSAENSWGLESGNMTVPVLVSRVLNKSLKI